VEQAPELAAIGTAAGQSGSIWGQNGQKKRPDVSARPEVFRRGCLERPDLYRTAQFTSQVQKQRFDQF
jgi:hypothetical protein